MRADRTYSEHGRGDCNGSEADAQSDDHGAGRTGRGRSRDVSKAPWFDEVIPSEDTNELECKDGFCPLPKPAVDLVNHPPHYGSDAGIECIEAIEAALTPDEFRGYVKGNCIKYIWRERSKGGVQSLEKADWYLSRLLSALR